MIQRCQITMLRRWEGSLPFRKGGIPPPAGCMTDCSGSDKMGLAFYPHLTEELITPDHTHCTTWDFSFSNSNSTVCLFFFGQTRRNAVRFFVTKRRASRCYFCSPTATLTRLLRFCKDPRPHRAQAHTRTHTASIRVDHLNT